MSEQHAVDGPVVDERNPAPRRSVGQNVVALFSSQLVTWVLSTVLMVAMPRFLGPVAIGELRVAGSLWAVVAVTAGFGTASLLTIEVAKRRNQARALRRTVSRLRAVIFCSLTPVVLVFCIVAGYSTRMVIIVAIGAAASVIDVVVQTPARAALIGAEEMGVTARVEIVCELFFVVAVVSLLPAGIGVIGVSIIAVLNGLLASTLLVRALRRIAPPDQEPRYAGRALARASSPYFFADAMITIYLQIDTVVISLVASERDVGYYAIADTVFSSLLFVPAVLMGAAFPAIAKLHDSAPQEVAGWFSQAFRSMMLVSTWIGLGTVLVSRSFTRSLFGADFAEAAPVLTVFGIVTMLSYQTILIGQFAGASGRPKIAGTLILISTIATIPLDLVLVPWTERRYDNGAIGGALAYIVTELFQVIAGVLILAPSVLNRRTALRFGQCALAGAAMLASGWPLRDRFFVVPAAVGSVVFFLVMVVLRVADDFERKQVRTVLTKLRLQRS